jgi:hypothetical protein
VVSSPEHARPDRLAFCLSYSRFHFSSRRTPARSPLSLSSVECITSIGVRAGWPAFFALQVRS